MKNTNFDQKYYRGRFAPSPTGELHFGSLLAAMASYADARSHNGHWLLRIDDIDQARVVVNSDKHILSTLEHCGFQWDENVTYQSQCLNNYQDTLLKLNRTEQTFACTCSRKQIKEQSEQLGIKNGVYPGTCRNHHKSLTTSQEHAIRLKTSGDKLSFFDHVQGQYTQNLQKEVGDFIIYRRDKVFSYQLSVVVDDFHSDITHIVRGFDLLDSTPKQIFLQRLLNYPQPDYAHIPLAVNQNDLKLSKLSHAQKVDCNISTLVLAANFLGQKCPDAKEFDNKDDFWQYLVTYWDINRVPKMEKQMILV